jgi:hypothetical protein
MPTKWELWQKFPIIQDDYTKYDVERDCIKQTENSEPDQAQMPCTWTHLLTDECSPNTFIHNTLFLMTETGPFCKMLCMKTPKAINSVQKESYLS